MSRYYNVYVKPEGRRPIGQIGQVLPGKGISAEVAAKTREEWKRGGDRPAGNTEAVIYENDEVVCRPA